MSFPQFLTKFELSDYILIEITGGPETGYKIYKKDNYSKYPDDTALTEIIIPYFCGEAKIKLGAFLPQFDKILCELLVVADRENVSRLFSETMKAIFPEEADNYELEIYERYGGLYSKIDYSQKYFKQLFGHKRGTTAAQMAMNRIIPPKRTMFQERDEIWEKYINRRKTRLEAVKKRREMAKKGKDE